MPRGKALGVLGSRNRGERLVPLFDKPSDRLVELFEQFRLRRAVLKIGRVEQPACQLKDRGSVTRIPGDAFVQQQLSAVLLCEQLEGEVELIGEGELGVRW